LVTYTFKKKVGAWIRNQSVSVVTALCLIQSDRVDQAGNCFPWNVVGVAGYWRELEHAVVHVDADHSEHAQLVTCLVSMQAMEEQGDFQLPGIVYRSLLHGAVHYNAESRVDGGG
jgi:hypothetical protein